MAYYHNDVVLNIAGYEIYYTRFADSIINDHFTHAKEDLKEILLSFKIDEKDIIKGGGGLSSITQKLATLLYSKNWKKAIIESEHHVGGKVLTSESHEVDHYKTFTRGNIGLEIEWNNKDPFYDRDLENFRKLHQIGELSLGIIITRGESLQKELYYVFKRFLYKIYPFDMETLLKYISLSDGAKRKISDAIKLNEDDAITKIASIIYASKYGAATTHMKKLLLRINRGVGNPSPFILIGIGKDRLLPNEAI